MWKTLWRSLSNDRGQVPDGGDSAPVDNSSSSDIPERGSEDENWGVRVPYDAETPDVADSTPAPVESKTSEAPQGDAQPSATDEESFGGDLNLDPESFSPENKEIFKRMQAGYTKKMQKFKGYEGHLRNMERFYNDRDFAEQTLKQWAQKNGYSVVPSQFANNQPNTPQPQGDAQTNALQAKLVQTLKSKLPSEAQWLADGQASAIFEVMKEVLGPVLSEFQGFKTQKEENEWKSLETEYETTEQEFTKKYPGWEAHEDEMSKMLAFLNDTKAYRHPQYGSKHELLFKLVTGNASAIKQVTDRVVQAGKMKTPTSAPGKKVGSGFASVQDEVAATTDKKDAFALAATKALQQLRRKR